MQESASFWTDIKNLEEQLVKSPDSFCFARLSEVYLKVGLIDDALHVARQGVLKYPRYLSGQKALSFACHAKGLNNEALAALKLVAEALPEDVPAQKLLGCLCAETGNYAAARQAFRTALEFAPDDVECRIELESLERSAGVTEFTSDQDEDDEEIIEDLEILEESAILEEYRSESELQLLGPTTETGTVAAPQYDPLSTGTLAELYVTQGFIHKALDIYRSILADNPGDRVIAERVVELEALEAGPSEPDSEIADTFEDEAADELPFSMPTKEYFQETGPELLPEYGGISALESQQSCADVTGHERGTPPELLQKGADTSLSVLAGWLENIRRIKLCR